MKNTVTVNKEQKLYVFNHGKYYTCLGFDVMQKRKERLATELNIPLLPHRRGSLASYYEYANIIDVASKKNLQTGWRSTSELIPEFIGHEGKRVQVIDCYGETRRFYIGKSTGFIPCHLEVLKSNSSGGQSVYGYPFKQITFLT